MDSPLQLSFVNFKKDSYIIVEGKQNADRFFIIRSGKVRIAKEVEVVEEEGGNVLGPGDSFGVVSTMSNHSHIETAQAVTDCTLISVHRDQYGPLIEKNTPVAMKIIMAFSKRMRYLDEALTRLTLKNTAEADPSHLFRVAEYYAKQSQYNQAFFAYYQYLKHCPTASTSTSPRRGSDKIKPYSKAVYLDGSTEEFNRFYPKDTMIMTEGMPGSELYIIQKGSVKITEDRRQQRGPPRRAQVGRHLRRDGPPREQAPVGQRRGLRGRLPPRGQQGQLRAHGLRPSPRS